MAAEEKTQSTTSDASPSSGGNKLVFILTLVNVIATLGMIAVLVISFQKDKVVPSVDDISVEEEQASADGKDKSGAPSAHGAANGKEEKKGTDFGKMVTLEQFTVNLSTPGSANPKFVRVNISLEVPNSDSESEVGQKMPRVRNAIIDLFNSKRPADLATTDGREYLKEEIRNALNSFMVTGKVKGVFFTNFAVSS